MHTRRLLVEGEGPAPDVQRQRRVGQLPQPLRVVGVLEGHDPQVQAGAVLQDALRPAGVLVQQGAPGRRGQVLHQGVLLRVGVEGPLRGDKVVQHPQGAGIPQPLRPVSHSQYFSVANFLPSVPLLR